LRITELKVLRDTLLKLSYFSIPTISLNNGCGNSDEVVGVGSGSGVGVATTGLDFSRLPDCAVERDKEPSALTMMKLTARLRRSFEVEDMTEILSVMRQT